MKCTIVTIAAVAAVLSVTQAHAAPSGEALFNKRCIICHVVKGRGAAIGPELTKVSSRIPEKDIREKLANPRKNNPTSTMPAFKGLSRADTEALIGYLATLK